MRQWRSFGSRLLEKRDDGGWAEIADFNKGRDAALAALALNTIRKLATSDEGVVFVAEAVAEAKRLL